ncbi:MAG: ECF transporter S component [Clostridia bacterium]|nr:ECF transporter S component [Clostridia bacterium]
MKKILPALLIAGGAALFLVPLFWGENRLSLALALLCCLIVLPFFFRFERRGTDARKAVLLAAFTALSVAGRVLFAPFPSFKPVAALVALGGAFFGGEFGFLCGALTALLSNFYFGQGPWTPFQMLSWGLVGLGAAYVPGLKKSPLIQGLFGVLSGVFYSAVMDIFTTVFQEGGFSLTRYLTYLAAAIPVTATYAVSNVLFLWLLTPGIRRIAERLGRKYGFVIHHFRKETQV